jgi:alpha-amylase
MQSKITFRVRWLAGLLLIAGGAGCGSSSGSAPPAPWKPGDPLVLDVAAVFPAGTAVRDAYSGWTGTVATTGSVTLSPGSSGVVLLERDGAAATPFRWQNATVYFVLTDRFSNGDPTNDGSYGRTKDGASEIGTWHGGDWKGLTAKLPYLSDLGVSAIWISPIVEQVHGWVAGGSGGSFRHHGYAGYWALDFTRLDKNLGTAAELQTLVDEAHKLGIRVIADVVMNHPGYGTGADLLEYLPEVFRDGSGAAYRAWTPAPGSDLNGWNGFVDYRSPGWLNWWASPKRDSSGLTTWVRAGSGNEFPGFPKAGLDDLTMQLASLPDFVTEGTVEAGMPTLFARKALTPDGTGVTEIPGATVRQYLVKWQSDWVRQFGFDGFRCDTAKHVELGSWRALKDAGTTALAAWKVANPAKKIDDAPFWMTGEVFGHGVSKDAYYSDGGFDSLINFDFQPWLGSRLGVKPALVDNAADLEGLYARYAAAVSPDPTFGILSYVSSHDTLLWFSSFAQADAIRQREAGTALLLAPGGVQVFYGDESGRRPGPDGGDSTQGTRSDMNWTSTDASILSHWQKLGNFRKRHAAVGAGSHQQLASPTGTYAFSRKLDQAGSQDSVVVVVTPTN